MNFNGYSMSSLSGADIYPDSSYASNDQGAAVRHSGGEYQTGESPRAVATALVTVILILATIRVVYELAES